MASFQKFQNLTSEAIKQTRSFVQTRTSYLTKLTTGTKQGLSPQVGFKQKVQTNIANSNLGGTQKSNFQVGSMSRLLKGGRL